MSEFATQFSNPFAPFAKQFAQSAVKANLLAFEGFERALGLQLKSAEANVRSTLAFMAEAAEVDSVDAAKAIWPKGVALVKDSSEAAYSIGQEVLGQTLKTGEAISNLYKAQFESANESLLKAAPKAAKK